MSHHISRTLSCPFDTAIARVTDALEKEGFGILADIDVRAILERRIGSDFDDYRILGARNPRPAHQAPQADDRIDSLLPCNVVVRRRNDGETEVCAIDPSEAMGTVDNPALTALAASVTARLERVVSSL